MLNFWISNSEIFAYHADFHEGHVTVVAGQRRGMARPGNGTGTAWARHAVCESALRVKELTEHMFLKCIVAVNTLTPGGEQ
jgi:hypothetical protein